LDTIQEENNIRNDAVALMLKANDGIRKEQMYAELALLILRALLLIANCIRQQR
jgi:hypothetical protein